eukprot:scpid95123/ scgid12189/ Plasma cell-induced resident endoplasmic reticulum protein; Proapoptotic caspase adapter protein
MKARTGIRLPLVAAALLVLCLGDVWGEQRIIENVDNAAGSADSQPDFVQGDPSKVPPRPRSPDSPQPGMSLKVPKLTPEEEHSTNLPSGMKCDACQAVVYQMVEQLKLRESKQLSKEKGKPLRESQYLEVFEDLCNGEWSGYGVKDVDGVHMLSGPGLSAEGHMSMMYGGGMWPRRLNKKCGQIVEDMGEDELYQAYYSMKDKPSGINPLLFCKTILPDCKTKATQKKKSSKQEL